MRSVTFKSILHGVALRMGLEPEENLQVNQAQAITEYINTRTRQAWEWADWPELVATEERAFAEDYISASTYASGAIVFIPENSAELNKLFITSAGATNINQTYVKENSTRNGKVRYLYDEYDGSGDVKIFWTNTQWVIMDLSEVDIYYYSTQDVSTPQMVTEWQVGSLGSLPLPVIFTETAKTYYTALQAVPAETSLQNSAYWSVVPTANVSKLLPRTQTGKTVIGDIFNIYTRDPRVNANPGELDWFPEEEGFRVNTVNPSVWVYYRKVPSLFTETPYSTTRAYVTGDRVYSSTTGECYLAIASSTGVAVTDTTKWTKIDMPRVLSDAVKCAAYADTLREAGQDQRAAIEEDRFQSILIAEMDKITLQAGRWPRYKAQLS